MKRQSSSRSSFKRWGLGLSLVTCGAVASWIGLARSQERSDIPEAYETWTAAAKQAFIWDEMVVPHRYPAELPALTKVNPLELIFSALKLKLSLYSDFAPEGYKKPIHAHGVLAKVHFEAQSDSPYNGLFKGVDFGFLRASVTADPASMNFAPGVALKFLIDGQPSKNISLLYKLSGQAHDYNFFANELSNIVPIEIDPKSIFSNSLFLRASKYPNKVSVKPFARIDQAGVSESSAHAPEQIYLVPIGPRFASAAHDFRQDFLALAPGTALYDVYATDESGKDFLKIDQDRRSRAQWIGTIVMDSEFVASSFADDQLFFKHESFDENP